MSALSTKKGSNTENTGQMAENGSYRWWILAGCVIIEALSLGAVNNSFALYTIPVTEGLGISREVFAMGQTLIFVGTMLMNTLVGGVIERIGIRRTMRISAVLMSLCFISYAFMNGRAHYMAASLVIGLCMPLITAVPISLLIQKWFDRNVGLALGIAFMGSGLGGMIFNPLGSFFIQTLGWRYAYGIIGLLMFVMLGGVSFLIIREPETQTEMTRSGENAGSSAPGNAPETAGLPGENRTGERRSGLFVVMMALAFCMGAGTYSIINFTSTYLQDMGYTASFAAGMASVSMGAMAAGKLVVGRMYDRIGVKYSTYICIMALFIGMIGFTFIKAPWGVWAVTAGSAIGCPIGSVAHPIIIQHMFGDQRFARNVGLSTAFGNFGAAVTPMLSGFLYENAGSYLMFYQIMAVLMAAAFTVYIFVFRYLERGKQRSE